MNSTTTLGAMPTPEAADDELWDSDETCAYFGGGSTKPIHISTLYRGIAADIYPKPINVSPNVVRWLPSECRAARQRMLRERSNPKPPTTKRRGRKRRQRIA
jgi:hypothetical protein